MSEKALPNEDVCWRTYQRVGSIEARPWTAEDEYNFVRGNTGRISISPADRERGVLHGGMVARNPANHDDQWYIAPEYFAKHYGDTNKMAEALRYIATRPAGSLPDGVRTAALSALKDVST